MPASLDRDHVAEQGLFCNEKHIDFTEPVERLESDTGWTDALGDWKEQWTKSRVSMPNWVILIAVTNGHGPEFPA